MKLNFRVFFAAFRKLIMKLVYKVAKRKTVFHLDIDNDGVTDLDIHLLTDEDQKRNKKVR